MYGVHNDAAKQSILLRYKASEGIKIDSRMSSHAQTQHLTISPIKYEEIYPKSYIDGQDALQNLGAYFPYYNEERPHSSLSYRFPGDLAP